jgi:hypothetical protein
MLRDFLSRDLTAQPGKHEKKAVLASVETLNGKTKKWLLPPQKR